MHDPEDIHITWKKLFLYRFFVSKIFSIRFIK